MVPIATHFWDEQHPFAQPSRQQGCPISPQSMQVLLAESHPWPGAVQLSNGPQQAWPWAPQDPQEPLVQTAVRVGQKQVSPLTTHLPMSQHPLSLQLLLAQQVCPSPPQTLHRPEEHTIV
jgi:hypothetical protein